MALAGLLLAVAALQLATAQTSYETSERNNMFTVVRQCVR